jgi:DNA-binding SARP family transcriptional activator
MMFAVASGPGSLRIKLLGGFSVSVGDRAVEEGMWRLRKARTLLKLVALTPGHALHRDQVIEILWPDRDAAAAANNLRQALFLARRAIDSCGGDGGAWLDL